ncbi:MAG: hypothetical protein LQ339_008715 [Xanthoria mediterranea]|nr:MAG: hypothetical protein LQ339_008715 [Xanthoria mediterranea]
MELTNLLLLSSLLSLATATCNRDNCLRALAGTPTKASSFCATYTKNQQTATPIPTYGSFCSNLPSRVSSACSCVVTPSPTSAPTCVPSPVIDASTRNGNFEDYPPPGQGVFNIQPPWYSNSRDSQNAFGEYRTEPAGADGVGRTVARLTSPPDLTSAFQLSGQQPNVLPGAFLRLSQPITYCNGTTYAFSLYARQLQSLNSQSCRLSFFTDFEGTIASFETPAFTDQFQKFGPVTRKPFRDNGVLNAKGEWEDRLDILVQCTGITGKPVVDTLFEVDAVRVVPVAG